MKIGQFLFINKNQEQNLSGHHHYTIPIILLLSLFLLFAYGCSEKESSTSEPPDPVLEFVSVGLISNGEKDEYEITLINKTEHKVVDLVVEISFFFGQNKAHKNKMMGSTEIPSGGQKKYKFGVDSDELNELSNGRRISYSVNYSGKISKGLIPFAGERTFINDSNDMLQRVHSLMETDNEENQ